MGDFNCDLNINNLNSTRFKNLINSVNMKILPSKTTFHLPNYDSLLDLTIVKLPKKVQYYEQVSAPGFSHHDLIFMAYQFGNIKYSILSIQLEKSGSGTSVI
uniref:Reverse transcriptase n=1 Tax=Cacopsylla melanoneura TaxID=428564 RepID=A0A8D8XJG4_9HEMI